MVNLTEAVRLTKSYAAFFHSYLDPEGLHRWLISEKIVPKKSLLRFSQKLTPRQISDIQSRQETAQVKVEKAKRVVRFLSFFSTISLVAVTGSLAVGNARQKDDIDLMVITHSHTLWLTRLFVIPLLSLFFPRRHPATKTFLPDAVCLNLWLDESALAIPENKRNLYTAHEVIQALPLLDRGGCYYHFLTTNHWSSHFLANAFSQAIQKLTPPTTGSKSSLFTYLLIPINLLSFLFQYLYMKRRITQETISLHAAFFHPRDLSPKLNQSLGIY